MLSAEKYTPEENSVICLKPSFKSFYCAFFTSTLTNKDLKQNHENSIWINVGILSLHQGSSNSFDQPSGVRVKNKVCFLFHTSIILEKSQSVCTSFVPLFIHPFSHFYNFSCCCFFFRRMQLAMWFLCYFPLMKIQCFSQFSIIL